jgi:succinyl-CoA synthetase alpha subunit
VAILVEEMRRIVIQGITGSLGVGFAERMRADGDPLVGGVTPGRGGRTVAGTPVFHSMAEAVRETGATASLIVVPPAAVLDAIVEAAACGVRLISIYTEHVPVRDAARAIAFARSFGARVVGPNAAGIASPGIANLSDIHGDLLVPGPVAIVSKSGTLVYEVIDGLRGSRVGISTVACLGGDEIVGTSYTDLLPLLAADPQTEAVVLIGELGGGAEFEAAWCWNELGRPKPLVAYVAGWSAPLGKRMGHAGAIAGGRHESAEAKREALRDVGAVTVETVTETAAAVVAQLGPVDEASGSTPLASQPS